MYIFDEISEKEEFPLFDPSGERWRNSDHEGGALVDEPRKDYQAARFVRDQDRKIPGFRSHRQARRASLSLSLCSNGQ